MHEAYLDAWEFFTRVARPRILMSSYSSSCSMPSRSNETAFPAAAGGQEILYALRQFPRPCAGAPILADPQEFTYREIQDILGIPLGILQASGTRTVKRHLYTS